MRVAAVTGPEASDMLRQMHGEDVAPVDSYVGRYRSATGRATLYISRFSSAEKADTLLEEVSDSSGRYPPGRCVCRRIDNAAGRGLRFQNRSRRRRCTVPGRPHRRC